MPDGDWKALYPYDPHEIRVDGYRYHYLDEGNGEPLLMVHGNPTWSFYWRGLVDAFSPSFRCVVPDHLGCGLSDKPIDYPYQLASHIDNLVSLIDHLDLRDATILGHDWGGAIGMGAALQRPDRFKRYVLFNTGAFPPPYIPWLIRACRMPVFGKVALQGMNMFSRAALWMAVSGSSKLSPAVQQGLLAPYDTWDHRVGVYGFVKDIPASPAHPTWAVLEGIESQLPALVGFPTLLIWGMQDWCFRPECLRRFQELMPQAEVMEIEEAGHWVVEESTDQIVTRLQAFLNQNVEAV